MPAFPSTIAEKTILNQMSKQRKYDKTLHTVGKGEDIELLYLLWDQPDVKWNNNMIHFENGNHVHDEFDV